ncbi:MAG: DUF4383 domain-containing protein, partial [Chloroflexota bacterium]|nr:DUF4383 domain-containing protein [Chloroflexota bacterium]
MARTVAAVLGAAYLVIGVVGYVVQGPLLGLFEVNELLNLVHVVIGATLAYGATATTTALRISGRIGVILIALGLLGFVAADGFGI